MEKDARGKAAEAIDRRARQRDAAARAQQELTPEAVAAEEERQRVNAALLTGGISNPGIEQYGTGILEPSPPIAVDDPSTNDMINEHYADEADAAARDLSAKLAEAVQPVLDGSEETYEGPEPVGIGRAVIQWVLVPAEEGDGYELALQVQVDEQPPGGVVLEITTEMLERWGQGAGLQKNRTEHKKFAAGIIEKTVELAAYETGNALIFALEGLILGEPTRTQVGDGDEADQ